MNMVSWLVGWDMFHVDHTSVRLAQAHPINQCEARSGSPYNNLPLFTIDSDPDHGRKEDS